MLRKQSWVLILTGLTVGAPAAFATNDRGDRDDRLEDRVENKLKKDDRLEHVKVDVDKGVVTMSGEVATAAERARAERVARQEGARRVVNKVEIDSDKRALEIEERGNDRKERIDVRAKEEKERIDRETKAAKERLERPTAAPAPVATHPVEHHPIRSASDAWITTKVKTKFLAEDMLDKSDLHVDTDNRGVVTLSGTVPSETARNRAVEITRTTEGVRQVVDKVVVGAPVVR
jgi:hyperosmotically inducible protein